MDAKLREKILSKIKPSEKSHDVALKIVSEFLNKIEKSAKNQKVKCDFFVGGSFGKNTYLKGNFDVDVFCRFDLSYKEAELSLLLEKILTDTKLKFKKQKGSRDYFSLTFGPKEKEMFFEIIPNRNIKNLKDALNSTDVSPFHVEFVKKMSQKNPKLTDEIRLAKQYFKAKGLYGAESYINGFSGHVIDILICYYGSLEMLLLDAKTWGEQKCIDISSFYNSKESVMKSISEDKISNLIVVDPILKGRNAARALLEDKYYKFILASQNFTLFVEKDFEIIKKTQGDVLKFAKNFSKENNLKVIIYKFDFKISNESEDIIGSKLLKLYTRLNAYFISYDFNVFKENFFIDMEEEVCIFVYYFEKVELSKIKIAHGPKVFMSSDIARFLNSRKDFFVQDLRVCLYKKREITKIEQIQKISLQDMQKLLGKDMSFVKKLTYL